MPRSGQRLSAVPSDEYLRIGLMKRRHVAAILCISSARVPELVAEGRLDRVRVGVKNSYLYTVASVRRVLRERRAKLEQMVRHELLLDSCAPAQP